MWSYEHSTAIDSDSAGSGARVTPDAIWRLWADVENWGTWNADIEEVVISGPFAPGAAITMTPAGEDPVELRVAELAEGEMFVDEARFGDLVLRTTHRVDEARVTYRMEITGPGADEAGPRIGPAITADWPETMAALVALAAARG